MLFRTLFLVFTALSITVMPASASDKGKQDKADKDKEMKFSLVRGGPACEPACPEWIDAQGTITRQTPAAFAALLKTLGKRRPLIVIHSVGGNVDAATQIGALIRKHGFDVAVGRTQFVGCNPTEACAETEGKNGFRGTVATSGISYCASACVLVLAAGKQRILLPRAVVGVHQIQVNRSEQVIRHYRVYHRTIGGRREEIRRELIGTTKLPPKQFSPEKDGPIYGKLKTYVRRMGVEPGLIDLFQKAKYEDMHWLFEPDLSATKLVTARMTASELISPASATAGKSAVIVAVPLPPELPVASFNDAPPFTVPLPPEPSPTLSFPPLP